MEPTLATIQDQVKDVCQIYTNLTSILLEFGYEYMLEHLKDKDDIACIAETLNILELLEKMVEDEPEKDDDGYLLRLDGAHGKIMAGTTPLVKRPVKEKEKLRDYYARLASSLDEKLADIYNEPTPDDLHRIHMYQTMSQHHSPPKQATPKNVPVAHAIPTRREVPPKAVVRNLEQQLMNTKKRITTLRLKRNINKKVNEKLHLKNPTTQDRNLSQNLNESVNTENLHLKI